MSVLSDKYYNIGVLFVILVASIFTILLVSDVDVRMATTVADDSILTHANYYKTPDRYKDDYEVMSMSKSSLLSALNYLPAIAFKYLDISPNTLYLPLVLLQNILLGLGVYFISRFISSDLRYNLITVGLYFLILPQFKNIADYGGLLWMPYAGHLAQGIILCAISAFLFERIKLSLLLIFISSFIHPMQTIQAIGCLVVLSLLPFLQDMREKDRLNIKYVFPDLVEDKKTLRILFGLFSIVIVSGMYFLIRSSFNMEIVTKDVLLKISQNGHIAPSFERIKYAIAFMFAIALFLPYALHKKYIEFQKIHIIVVSTALLVFYIIFHLVSVELLFKDGMRFLGTRFSQLWLLLIFPFFAYFVYRRIKEAGFLEAFMIVSVCLVQVKYVQVTPSMMLLYLGLAFYVRPSLFSKTSFANNKFLISFIVILNIIAFDKLVKELLNTQDVFSLLSHRGARLSLYVMYLSSHYYISNTKNIILNSYLRKMYLLSIYSFVFFAVLYRLYVGELTSDLIDAIVQLLFAITVVVLILFARDKVKSTIFLANIYFVLPALFIGQSFVNSYKDGREHVTGKYSDYHKMQQWVKANTKKSDVFLLLDKPSYFGWRGYTGRPLLTKNISSIYLFTNDGVEFKRKLDNFFREQYSVKNSTTKYVCFKCLSEEGFKVLKDKFKLSYIVVAESNNLLLKEVYKTKEFKILEL